MGRGYGPNIQVTGLLALDLQSAHNLGLDPTNHRSKGLSFGYVQASGIGVPPQGCILHIPRSTTHVALSRTLQFRP